ncbi:class II fructose-bisphosphate aldolase family protein [Marinomonas sp. 15G1-11]|uniref:Class II fructose-bisphosphate aldolase family protein n=1 Tax=Marinomonas phaeophyticola TaxID=3004091 RepID=A0ABT4JWZ3_9GAMM|nr:class II fructose-bisphosphate aldolase [Marinomonas sp. 15G1-11]MCZ2722761.1 class II fructose-bisphosphate aldolase family protein [Marinomonas sp. 15G1-11]
MLVTLNEILPDAANSNYAIPCCNVFGYEEGRAIVEAAEALKSPIILAANKDMVDFMGVEMLAKMLVSLATSSSTKVCVHLDHTYEEDIVFRAMHHGFSSVMFDGSQLSLEENIQRTKQVAQVAHSLGVSVEGEIGSVAYKEGRDHIKSINTSPEDAYRYATESGLDAMAIAIGNVHRLTTPDSVIDYNLLASITDKVTDVPLVIHGTTGIKDEDILRLKTTRVSKFNIGTSLRMAMGSNLRRLMNEEPDKFDKMYFMQKAMPFVRAEAERIIQLLR